MSDGAPLTKEDWGKFALRLAIGGLMLFHGIDKLTGGIDGISGMVEAKGLPAALAYGVYVGEILAPLAILVGFRVRTAGLIFAGNMAVAVYLAHMGDLTSLGSHGGYALELQFLYLLGGLAVAGIGGGRLALGRKF